MAKSTVNSTVNYCSCLQYVEAKTGTYFGVMYARQVPVGSAPHIGGIVITRESSLGHAAVIVGISNGNLILDEANYQSCKHTTGRLLPINSPLIKGFV